MADTNQEQLLSDLLGGIAREDAGLEAAHLEARVMASLSAPRGPLADLKVDTTGGQHRWHSPYVPYSVAAALVAMLLMSVWATRTVAPVDREVVESPRVAADAPVSAGSSASTTATSPTPLAPLAPPAPLAHLAPPPSPLRGHGAAGPAHLASADPDEFLPLMPMTDRELSGPFQLVRVQMPRASLGALRSPLDQPNEIVEADVLLGEDGMARAIRVSSGGVIQPWRSR